MIFSQRTAGRRRKSICVSCVHCMEPFLKRQASSRCLANKNRLLREYFENRDIVSRWAVSLSLRPFSSAATRSSTALLVICFTSSTFISCLFGESGLRPFTRTRQDRGTPSSAFAEAHDFPTAFGRGHQRRLFGLDVFGVCLGPKLVLFMRKS